MAGKFVHLHNHTEFSLLDGAQRLGEMIEQAKRLRMPALAVTEHGVMYGAVPFYQKAREAGIKPILGVEAYIAPGSKSEKQGRGAGKPYYHLVLLARNLTGYRNLVKLVSIAHLEGFHYKPRIDKELLAQHSQGIIALSGCLGGEINQLLMRGQQQEAEQVAKWYRDHIDYYLEIQRHHLPEQDRINPALIELSQSTGVPLVATNDVHYLRKEDQQAQEILVCIQTGKTLADERRTMRYSHHHYLKSPEEMAEMFGDIPDAITNTIKIAEKCDLILELNRPHLPRYPLPGGQTPASYLTRLAREGLRERYPTLTPALEQRLDTELQLIEKMGFADYFLVVWDFIRFAREQGIMVGPGRGSAAGSLVAYCLKITNIDPIAHHLLFERFLNPERISMPDIDIDFCIERRGEVIKYVTEKYGADHVCQIVTFGTLGAKQVIRDVVRVMGRPVADADRLAKLVPAGPNVELADALADGAELKKVYDAEPETREIIDIATKLEGLSRHASVHAAGVVISQEPLTNVVPLQRTSDGQVSTQFPMGDIEKLGLLKMDFLGLRNLTMIDRALRIIKGARGVELDIDKLPMDDAVTYKLLKSGDVVGVFQLDSSAGIRKLVKDLAPATFEEIVAVIALYRPGPLGSGMVDEYIERKHKRRPIVYDHPLLEPILKDSYGICVYQEQIMQIAQQLAGYSLGQADLLRRAMGKKKPEEMAKQKETFLDGAARNGIRSDISTKIFDTMEKFAEYGFNKCLVGETEIMDADSGRLVTMEELYRTQRPFRVASLCMDRMRVMPVSRVMENGIKDVFTVTTATGKRVTATANHPLLTLHGWRRLDRLWVGQKIATPRLLPYRPAAFLGPEHLDALAKVLADTGRVPAMAFQLPPEQIAGFLAAVLGREAATDGAWDAPNEAAARHLQHLLLRLGLRGRIDGRRPRRLVVDSPNAPEGAEPQPLHRLLASWTSPGEAEDDPGRHGGLSLQALPDRPAAVLAGARHTERLPAVTADVAWEEIVAIEPAGRAMTYDLTVPQTHNFVAGDVVVHNSHSAAYAVITYQTAYLKANYPVEYMAALISSVMSNSDKLQEYVAECNRQGLDILPPHVNTSGVEFGVEDNKIRFGLAAVRNVGENAVRAILQARAERPFTSLYDFCARVDLSAVNKRALESLIKCGTFDAFGHRAQLLAGMEAALDRAGKHQKEVASGQTSLFALMGTAAAPVEQMAPPLPMDVPPWSAEEQLTVEKEMLGIYLTGHPLHQIRRELQTFCSHTSSELKELPPDANVVMGGMITEVKKLTTKKNDAMAVFKLEDQTGVVEVLAFPKTYARCAELIAPDARVLVRGKLQVRDDERTIALNNLYRLPDVTTFHIRLDERASLQTVLQLLEVLRAHGGPIPVMLHAHTGETIIIDDSRWVKEVGRDGQLVKQLERLQGVAATRFRCPAPAFAGVT